MLLFSFRHKLYIKTVAMRAQIFHSILKLLSVCNLDFMFAVYDDSYRSSVSFRFMCVLESRVLILNYRRKGSEKI